eukprot:gene45220-55314_t
MDLFAHPRHVSSLCQLVSHSNLVTLMLNGVGLDDYALMELAKVLPSSTIRSLQCNGNNIGPTGANVIANIAKHFHIDVLSICNGQKVKAANLPFPDEENSETSDGEGEGGHGGADRRQHGDNYDDTLSYVDTDLFDGEESDDQDEDEDEEVQRKSLSLFSKMARMSWKAKKK